MCRVNCQINRRLPQIQSLAGLIGLSCFWDPRGTAENRHEKNISLSLFQRVAGLDDVRERGWVEEERDTYMADKGIEAFCNAKLSVVLGSFLGTPLTATGGPE